MENSSALAVPTSLPLTRTCFSSEQDRLDTFAAHLRVSVQAGESVVGPEGAPGPPGTPADQSAIDALESQVAALQLTVASLQSTINNLGLTLLTENSDGTQYHINGVTDGAIPKVVYVV